MLGRIELLDGDERYRITGEHRRIGVVPIDAIRLRTRRVRSTGEGGEDQVAASARRRRVMTRAAVTPIDRREPTESRPSPTRLAACRRRQDRDREGGRGGRRLQFEPEAGRQGEHNRDPNADRQKPRRSTERRQSSTDAGWSRSSWDRFSRPRWRRPREGGPDGCGHANDKGDAPCNGAHDLTPDAVRS